MDEWTIHGNMQYSESVGFLFLNQKALLWAPNITTYSLRINLKRCHIKTQVKSMKWHRKNQHLRFSLSTERSSKPKDLPVVCKHQPVFNNNKTLRSPTKHVGEVQQYATIREIVHLQHIYNSIFSYDQDLKSVL